MKYVDVDKEPELARAAGHQKDGVALVQVGDRKEEARSMTEEGVADCAT